MMCCWVPDEWHFNHLLVPLDIVSEASRWLTASPHAACSAISKNRESEFPPTGGLNGRTVSVDPFDRKVEQVFHDFIVDLDICFGLVFQTGDDV